MTTALSIWTERIVAAKQAAASVVNSSSSSLVLPVSLPRRFGLISGRRSSPPFRAGGVPRADRADGRVAATLAPRADDVVRAEQSALLLAERLVPWGAMMPEAIEWFVVDGPMPTINDFGSAFSSAQWSAEAAVEEAEGELAVTPSASELQPFCRACIVAHGNWQSAIDRDLEVPSNHWPREAVKWKKFAALADPTEAALRVWATGYLLEASLDETNRTLRFYAPAAR